MKKLQLNLLYFLPLVLISLPVLGQAVPAGDPAPVLSPGFNLPTLSGTLQYSLSVSESISNGFYNNSGIASSTNFSGNVALITASQRHPFSMVYSGGTLIGNSGQPSVYYQSLAFSQVATAGRWNFILSDGVSYLPESPTTGLSGIPGIGDVGLNPVQVGDDTGLGILTTYGPRVSNIASVSASRPITGSLSFQAGGSYSILRYLGDTSSSLATDGLDTSSESAYGGLNYRINARSSANVNYNISRSSFSGSNFTFISQGLNLGYTRQLTRRLTFFVSAGPQRVSSSNSDLSGASLSLAANAGLTYAGKVLTQNLTYSRGVTNGSGVIPGATSDSITYGISRRLGRAWGLAGSVGYARTKSLPTLVTTMFSSEGVTATGQVTRSLGHHFSAFGSYTIEDQTVQNNTSALNAFNGIYQVFGFGITFSPNAIHLGGR